MPDDTTTSAQPATASAPANLNDLMRSGGDPSSLQQTLDPTPAPQVAPAPPPKLRPTPQQRLAWLGESADPTQLKVAIEGGMTRDPATAARVLDLQDRMPIDQRLPTEVIASDPDAIERDIKRGSFDDLGEPTKAWINGDPTGTRAGLVQNDLPAIADLERYMRQNKKAFSYLPNGMIVEHFDDGQSQVYRDAAELYQSKRSYDEAAQQLADTHGIDLSLNILGSRIRSGLYGALGIPHGAQAGFVPGEDFQQEDDYRRFLERANDLYIEGAGGGVRSLIRSGIQQAPEFIAELGTGGVVARGADAVAKAATMAPRIRSITLAMAAMSPQAAAGGLEKGQDTGSAGQGIESFAEDEALAGAFGPVGPTRAAAFAAGASPAAWSKGAAALILQHAGLNAGQNASFALAHRLTDYANGDESALDLGGVAHDLMFNGAMGAALGAGFSIPEAVALRRARAMAELPSAMLQVHANALASADALDHIAATVNQISVKDAAPEAIKDMMATQSGGPGVRYIDQAAWAAHFTAAGEDPKAAADRILGPGSYTDATGGQLAVTVPQFALQGGEHQAWMASEMRDDRDLPNRRESAEVFAPVMATGETKAPEPTEAAADTGTDAPEPPTGIPSEALEGSEGGAAKPPVAAKSDPSLFGRPELANPGADTSTRERVDVVREARKADPNDPREHAPLIEAAGKRVAEDANQVERELLQRDAQSRAPTDAETFEAQELINRRSREIDAMPPGSPERQDAENRLNVLVAAYDNDGTRAGQALASRRDRIETPDQRLQTAKTKVRGAIDPAMAQRLRDAIAASRTTLLHSLTTQIQTQRTKTTRATKAQTPAPGAAEKRATARAEIRAQQEQIRALWQGVPGKKVPLNSGSVPTGPASAPMGRIRGVLRTMAETHVESGHGLYDFLGHALEAVPELRDHRAELDKAWDKAGGNRVAGEDSAAFIAADDVARLQKRGETLKRLWEGQIKASRDLVTKLQCMPPAERAVWLDQQADKGAQAPESMKADLESLNAERKELAGKIAALKREAAATRTPEEQDAVAEETAEHAKTVKSLADQIAHQQKLIERAEKRAATPIDERVNDVQRSRAQREWELDAMPEELRKLHEELDALHRAEQSRLNKNLPKRPKDKGREQDRDALSSMDHAEAAGDVKASDLGPEQDRERDTDLEEERNKLAHDKKLADVNERIKAEMDRRYATPEDRKAALEKIKAAGEAGLAKARAGESKELTEARAKLKVLQQERVKADKALTKEPLTESEKSERAIRSETKRAENSQRKAQEYNDEMAKIPAGPEREAWIAKQKEAGAVPDDIAKIRSESAERIKALKAEGRRLRDEGLTPQQHLSAQLAELDRQIAAHHDALQERADTLRTMTYPERVKMAQGKLQPIEALMKRMQAHANADAASLREQIRILSNPAEVADVARARRSEVAARMKVESIAKTNGAMAEALKARLAFDGFDLNGSPEWVKDPAQWSRFEASLAYARGSWSDKAAEYMRNAMHSTVNLLTVKPTTDAFNIHMELATLALKKAVLDRDPGALAEVWRGMQRGTGLALHTFVNAWNGKNTFVDAKGNPGWGEGHDARLGFIGGRTGVSVRMSMRMVNAIDQSAKAYAAHAVVGMHAWESAIVDGKRLQGDALKKHIKQEIDDANSESWQKARAFADRATLTEETWATKLASSIPRTLASLNTGSSVVDGSARVLSAAAFPFTRVPTNVITQGAEMVPFVSLLAHGVQDVATLVRGDAEARMTAKATAGERYKMAIARSAVGTLMGIAAIYLASKIDPATGQPMLTGFSDKDRPAQFMGLSYARLGPVAHAVGAIVDGYNTLRTGGTLGGAVGTAWQHVAHESLLRNFSDLANAMESAGAKTESFLVSLAAAAVPSFIKEGARNLNPEEVTRRGEGFGTSVVHAVTGGGAPRIDPFGGVVNKATTGSAVADWAIREVSPARAGDQYDMRPAAVALNAWNRDHPTKQIAEAEPRQTVEIKGEQVRVPDDAYQAALQRGGARAAAYIAAYLRAAGISPLRPTEEARKAIQHALERYRSGALRAAAGGRDESEGEDPSESGADAGSNGRWSKRDP